jgi:hypothetical protein
MIDYAKYANMNTRQLANALMNVEAREQKFREEAQKKLRDMQELAYFLKTKIKESLDKPKFISLKDSGHIEKANKYLNSLTSAEQAKLRKEVDDEMNRDYGNEL